MMRDEKTLEYKEGVMVVVRVDNQGKENGWFVGMIIREVSGGYLVRVSSPREYRQPTVESPRRKWYAKAAKADVAEDESHFLWSGWIELPRDPSFVLFSRIASSAFLKDIRERLGRKDISSERVREYRVSASQIFPVNRKKLYRAFFA